MANVGYATLQIIPSVRGIGNELRRQLVGPAGDAGDDAGEAAGGGFGDTFKGALAAIGVAEIAGKLGEQFTDAFGQALEQSHVTKVLQGQLGSSGATAKREGDAVGRLFANGVTENFEQGAEAIREVVRGGLVPPGATLKQLTAIGTKMTDVATVFGTDMNLQSQAVAALLKNGLVKDAGSALDLITVGFQKLGPNAEDLLETFQEYPVQLKKLGLDAKTAMGLFSQGIQGGARDTDILADLLKEFSIRSIDMSQGSQDAYKAIGLNAGKMSLQIAKGGKSATAGLQTVLDKLRDIHDPVKREAAAVGLFGTQAEEVGTALFKLDPRTAVSTFGSVGGAADKLGKTLRSGPSYEITVFTRALKQGLVDFIGGQVLPVLGQWGGVLNRRVLPPLSAVGGVLGLMFMPTLRILGSVLKGTVNWTREWGIWLVPLGIAIVGLTIAMNTQAIAIGFVTGVLSVYRAAILIGTAVTNGFAGAQAFLTAVMEANPIILVITAIIALGVALVIAYKRSETFRSIVQATWDGIKTGAVWLWQTALKPLFDGFMAGLRAVGTSAVWLWGVLGPVFGFIWTAAKVMATIVVVAVLLPIIATVKILGAIFGWLWTAAIGPAVGWIGDGVMWLWGVVKGQFGAFMAGIRLLGAVGLWLWREAFSPAIDWIVAGARLLWTGVKLQFGYFMTGIRALGAVGVWLWRTALSPAFSAIGTGATWLWQKGLKPPIDRAKGLATSMGTAFKSGAAVVGDAWKSIADKAKTPINYVIGTVYNDGIVPVWNKVAGAFGAPPLGKAKKFAVGGPVHGAGTETSDDVPAWLSTNEHVWTAREVRGAGGHGAVAALRRWAAAGGGPGAPGFKDGGGLFGWVGSAGSALKGWGSSAWDKAKAGASWLTETIAGSARAGINAVVQPLINAIPGRDTGFGSMIARIPAKMIDAVLGYSQKADDKGASAIAAAAGPGALGKWIAQAMRLTGVPASWAGPLRTLIMRESGGNPKAINLWDSNARAGHPSQGLMQTIPSTFAAYRLASLPNVITDPLANIVAGIRYILATYGSIFSVQQAVGSTPKGYARGGSPRPGEIAWVGERGPELLQFSGGEVVYSHADSMRMAAGLGGTPRGFATGSSSATRAAAVAAQLATLGASARPTAAPAVPTGTGPFQLEGDLYLDSGDFLGKVRGVVRQENAAVVGALRARPKGR